DQQSEWKKRDFVERLLQQQGNIGLSRRNVVEQADLLEILRCDRKRDRVADRLMKAVVRTVLEEKRLVLVGALIEIVTEFMMNGDEVLVANLNAHLDAQIVFTINVPSVGVADDFAITRLGEQRAFPECFGKRLKAQGLVEIFSVLHHAHSIELL